MVTATRRATGASTTGCGGSGPVGGHAGRWDVTRCRRGSCPALPAAGLLDLALP